MLFFFAAELLRVSECRSDLTNYMHQASGSKQTPKGDSQERQGKAPLGSGEPGNLTTAGLGRCFATELLGVSERRHDLTNYMHQGSKQAPRGVSRERPGKAPSGSGAPGSPTNADPHTDPTPKQP